MFVSRLFPIIRPMMNSGMEADEAMFTTGTMEFRSIRGP